MKISMQLLKELNKELKNALPKVNVKFSRLNNKHIYARWDNLDVNLTDYEEDVLNNLDLACKSSDCKNEILTELEYLQNL